MNTYIVEFRLRLEVAASGPGIAMTETGKAFFAAMNTSPSTLFKGGEVEVTTIEKPPMPRALTR